MKKLFLLVLTIILIVPVIAQDEAFVRFEVNDIIGTTLIGATLSPDGTKIAGVSDDALCIVDLESATSACVPFPEETRLRTANYFAWSPDNTKVVFHAEFFRFLNEPDLWQYNLETQDFTILTPDDVDDVLQDRQDALLDVFPVFNPIDDMLYFIRIQETIFGTLVTVQRMIGDGDFEQVAILTEEFFFGLTPTGHPVFSPDGTQMALPLTARNRENAGIEGVWIITLEDGSLEQITLPASFPGVPSDITDEPLRPVELLWHRDDTLMIRVHDNRLINILHYELNIEGTLTPLFDLSAISSAELFVTEEPITGLSYSEILPRDVSISADGTRIYYAVSPNNADIGLLSMALPPDERSLTIDITERLDVTMRQLDFMRQAASNGFVLIWQNYVIATGE